MEKSQWLKVAFKVLFGMSLIERYVKLIWVKICKTWTKRRNIKGLRCQINVGKYQINVEKCSVNIGKCQSNVGKCQSNAGTYQIKI